VALSTNMVTIDCVDTAPLIDFWTSALDYVVYKDWGDYALLVPADRGGALRIGLQRVPEPRTGKNRAHLDFVTEDRAAEVDRLVGLGARVIGEGSRVLNESKPLSARWTVMADPLGNEFCVRRDRAVRPCRRAVLRGRRRPRRPRRRSARQRAARRAWGRAVDAAEHPAPRWPATPRVNAEHEIRGALRVVERSSRVIRGSE